MKCGADIYTTGKYIIINCKQFKNVKQVNPETTSQHFNQMNFKIIDTRFNLDRKYMYRGEVVFFVYIEIGVFHTFL